MVLTEIQAFLLGAGLGALTITVASFALSLRYIKNECARAYNDGYDDGLRDGRELCLNELERSRKTTAYGDQVR